MYNYFVLHFFICQLIATCLACLCPFISFLIINLTFSKFVLMPTGIFLPSTCSDSTAKLCCVEEKMIHLAVNVEDSILSMHGHCKKGSPDRHEWTGRQSDRHTHRQRVWQTYKQRQTDRKMEGRQGRQAVGERKSRVLQKLQQPAKSLSTRPRCTGHRQKYLHFFGCLHKESDYCRVFFSIYLKFFGRTLEEGWIDRWIDTCK